MEFLHTDHGVLYQGPDPIILRGMGLGGWLLPEGYMWKFYTKCDRPRRMEALIEKLCGSQYAASFWKRYYSSFIAEKDIAWIASQGLNSIRLAMNARHLFHVDATGIVSFNEKMMRYVDDCISWCKKYELYLFLDMHGAPGGQTGQNIDDSENDVPELFTEVKNQDALIDMWRLLALRYRDEPAVGGYDLINEPLPKWNNQYNYMLLPLYRRLIAAIREVDQKHIIILEGAHWATDFSVFDEFTIEEASDNIVLQFHKYWSDPDEESISQFVEVGKRLNVPLWMGEGGENNLQWYTYVFPMYERLEIGWCFWSYKKMETPNSPVTFKQPDKWCDILSYLDGGPLPDQKTAKAIFDDFLVCVSHSDYHTDVIDALLRRPPIEIPAAAFDVEEIVSEEHGGADFRTTSKATLIFADGHTGEVDWRRYGGEPQPDDQKILLRLHTDDCVGYRVSLDVVEQPEISVQYHGEGTPLVEYRNGLIWLMCKSGTIDVESLNVTSMR